MIDLDEEEAPKLKELLANFKNFFVYAKAISHNRLNSRQAYFI